MSRIADLGAKLVNLPALIAEYEQAFENIEANLTIKGKTLDQALKEQSTYPIYYDARRVELKTLMKYLDAQVSRVRGQLTKKYKENYSRELGERQLNSYIDQEEDYLKMNELYLECEELYEKYVAAVEAFTKRGFALRDITLARVNQIQDALL